MAVHGGYEGPLVSLWHDFVSVPKSASVPWAALALALVGLTWRHRAVAVAAAVAIDVVVGLIRFLVSGTVTAGNGPTWVLLALAVVAAVRPRGEARTSALRGIALGALLVVATKLGDVWLHITVVAAPDVLDEYAARADHALGNPSWLVGQWLDALGPVVDNVLHWVYIELPVAAIVVALYQLRRGWPAHHLVRTFLAIGLIGPVFYILFPVVGPVFAFGTDGGAYSLGDFWPQTLPEFGVLEAVPFDDETPRNCMPSLHTAWALSIFVHTRRGPAWLRWGGAFWLVCTLAATLGFGYHYGVDLIAGAVLCLTIESALRDPERGWGRFRVRLVAGGAALFAALLLTYRYLADALASEPVLGGAALLGAFAAYVAGFYLTFFAQRRGIEAEGEAGAVGTGEVSPRPEEDSPAR
ncbi:inositol phosphorylceramide synthase [Rhodococcus sp. HNM0569]|nr:inositol phosphorylceramide synthase [Rhodococcus sp. HNM0569]